VGDIVVALVPKDGETTLRSRLIGREEHHPKNSPENR
jgi:hypothetical protein